jgi:RNA polymerase sigma factor (sigma-70 family)
MKDQNILDLFRNKQYSKASEKLYNYSKVVKKLILKNGGTESDAEDIYQEALIVLIKKIQNHNFQLSCSINTYLYSVSKNLWADALKKKQRSFDVDIEKFDFSFSHEDFEIIETESQFRLAEQAINQLGEVCKQLLNLFYFEKLDYITIAKRLQFSSDKVAKNQKYRCIEKAKDYFVSLKTLSHE